MGIPFTLPMGFLFTATMGKLFTMTLGIQLTVSRNLYWRAHSSNLSSWDMENSDMFSSPDEIIRPLPAL